MTPKNINEMTHSGVIEHKLLGKRRISMYQKGNKWVCENGLKFNIETGYQTNGLRMGYLDIKSIRKLKQRGKLNDL